MNPEEDDIERYEEQRELELYREYRDIVPMFAYVVETERRFYLANTVELNQREDGWVEVVLGDAWVWDMYPPGAPRVERAGADPSRRERRGAASGGHDAAPRVGESHHAVRTGYDDRRRPRASPTRGTGLGVSATRSSVAG